VSSNVKRDQIHAVRGSVLLLLMAPAVAQGQTSTATTADPYVLPAEGARTISWYGWETLSFDATFGVAVIASAVVLAHQAQSELWAAPIALPYIIATPIAHGVHDNLTAGLISGGIRLVVPATTFAIIRATCEGEFCRGSSVAHQGALWIGFVLSMVLSPLVDAALFAWEEN
jgi:hypothetical protein